MSDEIVHRFEVVVERRFIIYAPTEDLAGAKALNFEGFKGDLSKAPIRVAGVARLPPLNEEVQMPIIDRSPSGVPVGAK